MPAIAPRELPDYRAIGMVTERLPRRIPEDRLPILVTGISGVAGFNLFAFLRRRYGDAVVGQRPPQTRRLTGPGVVAAALEDRQVVRELVRSGRFRTVLSTGGSCDLRGCELDPAMARRVNVQTVDSLLQAADATVRLVHLSIDLVFGGTRGGGHREADRPDPVSVYGKTMAEAEQMVLSRRPDACIGRISLPMGISFNGHAGAIDWIQSRFAQGKPATLYYDEVRTPTYVECLAEVCEDLIAADWSGIWHLGGPRRLTLNEIAQIVNVAGGYDPALVRGCYRVAAGPVPPRAGDVTLDSSRLEAALGRQPFAPWPQFGRLVPDGRDWHWRNHGFQGSPEFVRSLLYQRAGDLAEEWPVRT